jgi:hypothetical protein
MHPPHYTAITCNVLSFTYIITYKNILVLSDDESEENYMEDSPGETPTHSVEQIPCIL